MANEGPRVLMTLSVCATCPRSKKHAQSTANGPITSLFAATVSGCSQQSIPMRRTGHLKPMVSCKKEERAFSFPGQIWCMSCTADGKRLLTSHGWHGMTRVWDTTTGKEFCQMVHFRDGTWAVF